MLKSLTSLRFVFALMVFLSHATFVTDAQSFFFQQRQWLKQGFVGVNFFFILSGFILSYTYFEKINTIKSFQWRRFYLKRFAKIFPSFWFSLLLSVFFAAALWQHPNNIKILFANLFLIQAWLPDSYYQWFLNPPAWSLSVEVFFYLLFPFFILLVKKTSEFSFSLSVCALIGIQGIATYYFNEWALPKFWFYLFPISNLILFLTGILLFLITRNMKSTIMYKYATELELISLLLFGLAIWISPVIPDTFKFIGYYLPFAALVVFIFSFQKGVISYLLSQSIPVYLGKISFQFYLLHFLSIWFWCDMDFLYFRSLSQNTIVILSFLSTIAASSITYHTIELPLQKLFKTPTGKASPMIR